MSEARTKMFARWPSSSKFRSENLVKHAVILVVGIIILNEDDIVDVLHKWMPIFVLFIKYSVQLDVHL